MILLSTVTYQGLAAPQDDPRVRRGSGRTLPESAREPCISGRPGRAGTHLNHKGSREGARTPHPAAGPLWFASGECQARLRAAGQRLSPEVPGGRAREDGLDSRLRLTLLGGDQGWGGLAGKTTSHDCAGNRGRPI